MEKRSFRRISLATLALGVIFFGCKLLMGYLAQYNMQNESLAAAGNFLGILGTYGLSIAAAMMIVRGLPKAPEEPRLKLTFGGFLGYFSAARGVSMVLALAGTFLALLIAILLKGPQDIMEYFSRINSLPSGVSTLQMIFEMILTCIVAPLAEELIFRKVLLDPIRPFGDKAAIFYNGITFGLLHMNFQQIFFASAIGMMFAYIMIRTNNLWYCIALHFALNTSSTILIPFLQPYMEGLSNGLTPELLALMLGVLVYLGLILLISIAGLVLFFVFIRKVRFLPPRFSFSQKIGAKLVLLNMGTIPYALLCIIMAVFAAVGVV